ncbi:MAG: peptidyl-prolyl cis-trans isomerase [Fimbriimonadaceae bacterium]
MKRFAFFTLATLCLVNAAFAQDDKPMIVVNGETIMRSNYIKRMEVLPGVGKQVGGRFIEASPGFLTLSAMINEMLTLQLAKEKSVTPSEAQITEEFDFRNKDNPNYTKAFTMLGFTVADIRNNLKISLAEFNLVTMGINIADAQVNKYYQDRLATDFTYSKRFRLRVIAVNSDTLKKKVDAEIASGKTFADIAADNSIDLSTKYDGGLMGDIPEEQLGGDVKTLVVGLKKGQTTSWIKATTSEVKIYLEEILPATVIKLDDVLKRKIRNKLMVDRGAVKNDVPKMLEDMRKRAKVEFQGTPFDKDLKDLLGQG